MTAPSAPLNLVTTALLNMLRAGERTVYDGAYQGDPVRPKYPYAVLYALEGGDSDFTPDLAESRRDVVVVHQITSVSSLRNQAQDLGQRHRDRFLTGQLVLPDGWQCTRRDLDRTVPGIDRVGDNPTAVFNHHQRVLMTISRIRPPRTGPSLLPLETP
jgi:hypothetical protein